MESKMKTNKGFKEWNAVIEALGTGKQSILIRNYSTNIDNFLLYPTVSYASKDDYLDAFQGQYHDFVYENLLPEKKNNELLIKYFAKVEKIIDRSSSKIPSQKYYIWSRDHVNSYIAGRKTFIWILRVYQLEEPTWLKAKPKAIKFANLNKEVSLDRIKPILDDSEFNNIFNNIIK